MNRTDRHRESGTDRRPTESTETTETTEETMGSVSHTHPYSDNGAVNRPFQRGPIVAADGGEREAYDEDAEETDTPEEEETETSEEAEEADAREEDDEEREDDRMKDVNHTPPHGEGVNPVFERGGKEESVESEE